MVFAALVRGPAGRDASMDGQAQPHRRGARSAMQLKQRWAPACPLAPACPQPARARRGQCQVSASSAPAQLTPSMCRIASFWNTSSSKGQLLASPARARSHCLARPGMWPLRQVREGRGGVRARVDPHGGGRCVAGGLPQAISHKPQARNRQGAAAAQKQAKSCGQGRASRTQQRRPTQGPAPAPGGSLT